MTHAEIDALLGRMLKALDGASSDEQAALLPDIVRVMTAYAIALRPFAQVAHYGTPSDCGGMLQQADWERVAQMFAPPKVQG